MGQFISDDNKPIYREPTERRQSDSTLHDVVVPLLKEISNSITEIKTDLACLKEKQSGTTKELDNLRREFNGHERKENATKAVLIEVKGINDRNTTEIAKIEKRIEGVELALSKSKGVVEFLKYAGLMAGAFILTKVFGK